MIKRYSPLLLKIRTNLLYDEKEEVAGPLNNLITELEGITSAHSNENKLIRSFECIARLNQVFCQDLVGDDLKTAYELARYVDNKILLTHVFRYSRLMDSVSREEVNTLLNEAPRIFQSNHMEDHALYCWNNRIASQFYTDEVELREFQVMHEEAIYIMSLALLVCLICSIILGLPI